MNSKRLRQLGAWLQKHKLLLMLSFFPVAVAAFLVAEHVRGRISLERYIRRLRAQREKMTAQDFMLPPLAGENGAPEVLAAARELHPGAILPKSYPPRMKLTPSGRAIVCFREEHWVEDKTTNHWEQLAADLEANGALLERIQAAMGKPILECGFDPTLGPRARFSHLSVPKQLTQWFGSRIAVGLHAGKTRETIDDLVTEIELPRMLERDGIVISELVRDAIAATARADIWEALQAEGWNDDNLAQLQQAAESQEYAAPMVRALEGERIFSQSTYQLMRKSNQETIDVFYGMEQFLPEERPQWERTLGSLPGGDTAVNFLKSQAYCRLWRFAWLDQDQLHYLRYLEKLIALGRHFARQKSLEQLEPLVEDLVLQFQNRGSYDRLRYHSEISVNSLSRVFVRAARAETERSLVLAALALKRYTLRHGTLPQSLTDLVPDFLPSVPVDCMDGGPLRYRPQTNGAYILYSVGEDGMDDGGDATLRPGKTNLRVIWERKDVVWPAPASSSEVEAYRAGSERN